MNVLLALCVIISLPFVQLHAAMSLFCQLITSIVILLKMIYHLDMVPNVILQSNCSVSEPRFISHSRLLTVYVLLSTIYFHVYSRLHVSPSANLEAESRPTF